MPETAENTIIDIEAARALAMDALARANAGQEPEPLANAAAPKAKAKKATPVAKSDATSPMIGKTRFVSRSEETSLFDVKLPREDGTFRVIRGSWLAGRTHIEWWVPDDLVDAMRTHFFVRDHRIAED
ncbi:MAG: hypothetical protein IM674_05065 [Brevundimonas sp.]|nr:hypothetical protein [Brevundimonas sp.]